MAAIFSAQGLCLRHRVVRHESGRCTAKAQGNVGLLGQIQKVSWGVPAYIFQIFQLNLADSMEFEWNLNGIWKHDVGYMLGICCQDRTYKYDLPLQQHDPFRQKPLEQSEMLCILKQARKSSCEPQAVKKVMQKSSESTVDRYSWWFKKSWMFKKNLRRENWKEVKRTWRSEID